MVRLAAVYVVAGLGLVVYDPALWGAALCLVLGLTGCAWYLLRQHPAERRILTVKLEEPLDPTLQIANETLPYLRRGLNRETARSTAEVIRKISDVPAVAITDRHKVLAFIGPGCDKHPPGKEIVTFATKQVIRTGELKIVTKQEDLQCPVKNCVCPLESAVIAPLTLRGEEVIGTIKLYRTEKGPIPPQLVKLATGIAQLLSVQMELAELDRQAQLVTKAELDALRAQINPHFLFNTLNTITMFIRTNPEMARRLLIRLASFFRHAFKRTGHFSTLREELECVNAYLVLEKARFREKLRIHRDVDRSLCDYQVPVLTLQPLVENAVKHGIVPKMGNGSVRIDVRRQDDEMVFIIEDNGVGIPAETLSHVLEPGFGSGSGVGLSNVHERLKSLFGPEHGLSIESEPGLGTRVTFRIPLLVGKGDKGGVTGGEA